MSETPAKPTKKRTVEQQLADKIAINPVTSCHIWKGARSGKDLYPILASQGNGKKPVYVHRLLWERKHGEIPQGRCSDGSHRMEIHHACESANQCTNVDHMVLLTSKQHFAIHRAMRACQPKRPRTGKYSRKKPVQPDLNEHSSPYVDMRVPAQDVTA
jgi:hypothetical protein